MTARLWSWWMEVFAMKSSRKPARRAVGARPGIEVLEDRTVPSPILNLHPMEPSTHPGHSAPPYYLTRNVKALDQVTIEVGSGNVAKIPVGVIFHQTYAVPTVTNPFHLTITVLNKNQKPDVNFRDTVRITVTGPGAISGLPPSGRYTFTAADQGVHTFNNLSATPGNYTVTVTDTANNQLIQVFSFCVKRTILVPLLAK